jgi:glycosyltransferase involved in cell wall biosynthesis
MKKKACIIAFSPIYIDSRILHQIKYLSPHLKLSVIGYGKAHTDWEKMDIRWFPVDKKNIKLFEKIILLLLGKMFPSAYDIWYWKKPQHREALGIIMSEDCDIIHANDWETLPIAVEASKKNAARVVFDAHEYSPQQYEEDYWRFKLLVPAIRYLLHKYDKWVDRSITVSSLIAKEYSDKFNLKPIVVLNAPDKLDVEEHGIDIHSIRLIHHGVAMRNRKLETMIDTLAQSDQRYNLTFMLVDHDPGYITDLKKLVQKKCPGRIFFVDPVEPDNVLSRISEFDIGFYILEPNNFNHEAALPNKLFQYIAAGLATCIGPSPAMVEIINQYKCGCIASSFKPRDVAYALNQTNADQWEEMRKASREAADNFTAENEMKKVIDLYNEII